MIFLKLMLCCNIFIALSYGSPISFREMRKLKQLVDEQGEQSLNLPSNASSIREDITDNFSCDNRGYGYYADVENDCQIFHVCLPVTYADGKEKTFRWSFICPESTIFSQDSFTCVRSEDMLYDCAESERYYELNRNFGMTGEMMKKVPVEDVLVDLDSIEKEFNIKTIKEEESVPVAAEVIDIVPNPSLDLETVKFLLNEDDLNKEDANDEILSVMETEYEVPSRVAEEQIKVIPEEQVQADPIVETIEPIIVEEVETIEANNQFDEKTLAEVPAGGSAFEQTDSFESDEPSTELKKNEIEETNNAKDSVVNEATPIVADAVEFVEPLESDKLIPNDVPTDGHLDFVIEPIVDSEDEINEKIETHDDTEELLKTSDDIPSEKAEESVDDVVNDAVVAEEDSDVVFNSAPVELVKQDSILETENTDETANNDMPETDEEDKTVEKYSEDELVSNEEPQETGVAADFVPEESKNDLVDPVVIEEEEVKVQSDSENHETADEKTEDEPSSIVKDEVPALTEENYVSVSSPVENEEVEIMVSKDEEEVIPAAKDEEEVIPAAKDEEEVIPAAKDEEEVIPAAKDEEASLENDEKAEHIAEKDEAVVTSEKNDEEPMPTEQKDEPAVPTEDEETKQMVENDESEIVTVQKDPEVPVEKDEETVAEMILDETPVLSVAHDDEDAPTVANDGEQLPTVTQDEEELPAVAQDDEELPAVVEDEEKEILTVQKDEEELPTMEKDEEETPEMNKDETETPKNENDEKVLSLTNNDENASPVAEINEEDTSNTEKDEIETHLEETVESVKDEEETVAKESVEESAPTQEKDEVVTPVEQASDEEAILVAQKDTEEEAPAMQKDDETSDTNENPVEIDSFVENDKVEEPETPKEEQIEDTPSEIEKDETEVKTSFDEKQEEVVHQDEEPVVLAEKDDVSAYENDEKPAVADFEIEKTIEANVKYEPMEIEVPEYNIKSDVAEEASKAEESLPIKEDEELKAVENDVNESNDILEVEVQADVEAVPIDNAMKNQIEADTQSIISQNMPNNVAAPILIGVVNEQPEIYSGEPDPQFIQTFQVDTNNQHIEEVALQHDETEEEEKGSFAPVADANQNINNENSESIESLETAPVHVIASDDSEAIVVPSVTVVDVPKEDEVEVQKDEKEEEEVSADSIKTDDDADDLKTNENLNAVSEEEKLNDDIIPVETAANDIDVNIPVSAQTKNENFIDEEPTREIPLRFNLMSKFQEQDKPENMEDEEESVNDSTDVDNEDSDKPAESLFKTILNSIFDAKESTNDNDNDEIETVIKDDLVKEDETANEDDSIRTELARYLERRKEDRKRRFLFKYDVNHHYRH